MRIFIFSVIQLLYLLVKIDHEGSMAYYTKMTNTLQVQLLTQQQLT